MMSNTSPEHKLPDIFLTSKMDVRGTVTYVSSCFCKTSGYTEKELLKRTFNTLYHSGFPKSITSLMWEELRKGNDFWVLIKYITKDENYFWIDEHIVPISGDNNIVTGYHLYGRVDKQNKIKSIEDLYKKLCHTENQGGTQSGINELKTILQAKGMDYDEFYFSL